MLSLQSGDGCLGGKMDMNWEGEQGIHIGELKPALVSYSCPRWPAVEGDELMVELNITPG